MTWVRAQYILAVQDENWMINDLLKGSNPQELKGCKEFITEMGEKRADELRVSRKASIMAAGDDCRDIRDYCGDIESFSVIETLLQLDELSSFGGIDAIVLRNTKFEDGQTNRREQAKA